MKYLNNVDVPNYYTQQLKIEHQYYEKFNDIISILILMLFDNFDDDNISASTLLFTYDRFISKYKQPLNTLIKQMSIDMYNLVENTVQTYEYNKYNKIEQIYKDINIYIDNTLQSILSRFITIVPIGYVGKGSDLFTDENTKHDLQIRSDKNINSFIQTVVTQGVVTLINSAAKYNGFTEYVAQNQHDNKVRPLHKEYFNGERWLKFDSPPPCGEVGTEKNCRCFIIKMR